MGVLYRYEFANGLVYIGRDLADDNFRRAKDHFYNAVVSAYGGKHIYHFQDKSSKFKFVKQNKPQVMEAAWGTLMKSSGQSSTFEEFSQIFIEKWGDQEELQNKIELMKTIIKKDSDDVKDWKKAYNRDKQHKRKKQIQKKDSFEFQVSIQKDAFSKLSFKNNLKGDSIGLVSWQVKHFDETDPFWKINDDNPDPFKYITTTIEKASSKQNLQGTALGEYLLIGLDMSTDNGVYKSLNREIGEYSKIYKDTLQKYSLEELNKYQTNLTKNSPINQINKMPKKWSKTIKKAFLLNTSKYMDLEKMTVVDKENFKTTFSVKDPLRAALHQWFNNHPNGAEDYWKNGTEDLTEQMLKESFKYTLIMKNLNNKEEVVKQREFDIKTKRNKTTTFNEKEKFSYTDLD